MADKKPANKKTSSPAKQTKPANSNSKSTSKGSSSAAKKPGGNNKLGKKLIISLFIIALLAGGYFVGLLYEDKIDEALGFRKVETYNPGEMVSIGGLNIHFIDVGQGDACLVELPDNRFMLIDAGDRGAAVENKLKIYIEDVNEAREAAQKPQIKYFDYVIVTHSDSDHIGSMSYILNLYPAATFYRPNQESTYPGYADPALSAAAGTKKAFWTESHGKKDTQTYKYAIEAGYKQHGEFKEGIVTNPYDNTQNCIKPDLLSGDGLYYEVNFYGPTKPTYNDSSKNNNYSPIIIIEYKNRRVALSGDAEEAGEKDFAAEVTAAAQGSRFYNLKSGGFYSDIIKLGHHGSNTSSTDEYFSVLAGSQYVENIYIVISVNEEAAKKKDWTHPHPEVTARVKALGIADEKVLRTDMGGDIFFALNFYEGQQRALVEKSRGGPITEISYPVFNGLIRYRNIGIAIIVILALILLPAGFIKKTKKQAKKFKL